VFFDNLQVRHDRGRIEEENHYYAHGLKIAAISSKAYGAPDNNYGYQGDFSELDDDLGWNDFELRSYDPQIGRFLQNDPYDEFPSPYTGMGNDPVNNIDPTGGFLGLSPLASIAVSALGGAIVGAAIDITSGGDGTKGLAIGAGAGLLCGFGVNFGVSGMLAATATSTIKLINSGSTNFISTQIGSQEKNYSLSAVIEAGSKSKEFRSLMIANGISTETFSASISYGKATETIPGTGNITIKRSKSLNTLIRAITHELSNRKYLKAIKAINDKFEIGDITPEDYADGILGIEANGIVSQNIVGGELNMSDMSNEAKSDYEKYKKDNSYRNQMYNSTNKTKRKVKLENGKSAFQYYKARVEKYYKDNKKYLDELKKQKDIIKKFVPPKIN